MKVFSIVKYWYIFWKRANRFWKTTFVKKICKIELKIKVRSFLRFFIINKIKYQRGIFTKKHKNTYHKSTIVKVIKSSLHKINFTPRDSKERPIKKFVGCLPCHNPPRERYVMQAENGKTPIDPLIFKLLEIFLLLHFDLFLNSASNEFFSREVVKKWLPILIFNGLFDRSLLTVSTFPLFQAKRSKFFLFSLCNRWIFYL